MTRADLSTDILHTRTADRPDRTRGPGRQRDGPDGPGPRTTIDPTTYKLPPVPRVPLRTYTEVYVRTVPVDPRRIVLGSSGWCGSSGSP